MPDEYGNLAQAARNRGYADICLEFCEEAVEGMRHVYPAQWFARECGLVGGTIDSPAAKAAVEWFKFREGMRKLLEPVGGYRD